MFISWFAPQLSMHVSQPAAAAIIIGAIVVYSIVAVLGKYKDTPVGGGGTSTRKNVTSFVLKHAHIKASKYLCTQANGFKSSHALIGQPQASHTSQ